MPDPVTAPVTPASPPPAPAATIEAPPAPAKQQTESFQESMRRLGWNPAEDAAPEGEAVPVAAEEAAPPDPAKPAPAAKPDPKDPKRPVVVAQPGADKLAQVKALATELGLELDNGRVSSKERADYRRWKAEQNAAIARREQETTGKLTVAEQQHKAKLERAEQLERAYEAGDYDAIAKLLKAKDWNDLQRSVVERLADPNYRKMRELEQQLADRTAREEQAKQTNIDAQASREKQAAVTRHINTVSAEMKASKDPIVAALHDDPAILSTIYKIQEEQYDGQRTVSAAQALRLGLRGAASPLLDELRTMYDRLHRAFGTVAPPALEAHAIDTTAEPAPPAPAPARAPTGKFVAKKLAPRTPVPPSVEAAPRRPWNSDKEYSQAFRDRLAAAAEEDRQAEEAARRSARGR